MKKGLLDHPLQCKHRRFVRPHCFSSYDNGPQHLAFIFIDVREFVVVVLYDSFEIQGFAMIDAYMVSNFILAICRCPSKHCVNSQLLHRIARLIASMSDFGSYKMQGVNILCRCIAQSKLLHQCLIVHGILVASR